MKNGKKGGFRDIYFDKPNEMQEESHYGDSGSEHEFHDN